VMWTQLRENFVLLNGDTKLRCVVITGEGGNAFAAGADISEFDTHRRTREQVARYHEEIVPDALRAIRECPVPVVAMVRGPCVGGGLEIAAMCDIRISAQSGRFGIPVARLGFSLAYGEMEPVLNRFGRSALAMLLFEARLLTATQACEHGLVDQVVADDALDARVAQLVTRILGCAPLATRQHKLQLSRLSHGQPPITDQERVDSYAFADTSDYEVGYRAFLAKSEPQFGGR
jgi:enoyl-CoA hydratase